MNATRARPLPRYTTLWAVLSLLTPAVRAVASDTWIGTTASPSWSVGGNWSTGSVPVSGDDVFMVGPGQTSTNKTDIGFYLHSVQFPTGAPVFRIQVTSAIHVGDSFGGGVINASGYAQYFDVQAKHALGDYLLFDGGTIGTGVQIINYGSTISGDDPHSGGNTYFNGRASAGQVVIYNYAAQASSAPGRTEFYSQSTAGTALITDAGGAFTGGTMIFYGTSTAGNAAIINEAATGTAGSGGSTYFRDSSSVGNARIANNGSSMGSTSFYGGAGTTFIESGTAGTAIITNHGGTAAGAHGGFTQFDFSNAGLATVTNEASAGNGFGAYTVFNASASAGNATISNSGGGASGGVGGYTRFYSSSTADHATINNSAAQDTSASSGSTTFTGGSAGSGTINNNSSNMAFSGDYAQQGGVTFFQSTATAGTARITNNGGTASFSSAGGQTIFSDSSTAASATLIANPGVPASYSGRIFFPGGLGGGISLNGSSTGGKARVQVFGNGYLDVSGHSVPGLVIGSIEGTGYVSLGGNNLTIGSNNRSTTFSGVIYDAGTNGVGSLTKTGTGKLTLSGANTYTGTTTIQNGRLNTKNTSGSATGSGPVQVNRGTLGGTGIVTGAVTVSDGSTLGAVLQPGTGTTAGTLTINNALTFNSSSTYKCVLNRKATPVAGQVSALGVTIKPNVTFTFAETGTAALAKGTVFTIINNTSANPISGRFRNLAGGSTFTDASGTIFKASYSAGTGNDVTLTVQ